MNLRTWTNVFVGLLLAATGSVALAQEPPPAATADPRVEAALKSAGLAYSLDDGDFRLQYDLEGDRSQVVWVASATARIDQLEFRDVWSVAARGTGEVPADVARLLLKENARMVLGGWAVNQGQDEYLVVFTAQVSADATPAALQEVIEVVALSTDRIEKELATTDDF
jgi:hypothetical protein